MSRHHRSQTYDLAKLRKLLAPTLPVPCGEARCTRGGVVYPGQAWDVSHIIGAAEGGQAIASNVVVAHRGCNRSAGGKAGRAMQLKRERDTKRLPKW